jgi:hypothetical protein
MRLIGVLMGYAESDQAAQSWLAAFRSLAILNLCAVRNAGA